MNNSNRPVSGLGEISVGPHHFDTPYRAVSAAPDCDDGSACPFAPLPRGEGNRPDLNKKVQSLPTLDFQSTPLQTPRQRCFVSLPDFFDAF